MAQTIGMRSGNLNLATALFFGAIFLSVVAFSEGLWELGVRWTNQEEYSHGFFIPLISCWLFWKRRDSLVLSVGRPNWLGLVLVSAAIAMLLIGSLSAIYILVQVGFIICLAGIIVSFGGWSLLRVCTLPLAFLLFAIPLPYFVDSQLSWRLQLVSSELGVFFIRLFGVSVFLEGNVIDLGNYQLQVVEACSGLRYLYPLLSLGFLAAYFFKAPLWQRIVVFLSTIPITIFMNSFRIGVIGLLVDHWGIDMAEGFLHYFEGWIIFLACALLLALEIYLFARLTSNLGLYDALGLPRVDPANGAIERDIHGGRPPVYGALVALVVASIAVFAFTQRDEIIPDRERFVSFPKKIGDWNGKVSLLEPRIELKLGLEDYILADFRTSKKAPVNLYIAYYSSQRSGVSPHSPQVCIPGGGWLITKLERRMRQPVHGGEEFPYNRVVIERESTKQIVYYWFDQRGKKIANEYMMKWHLLKDAIIMNRTDGTLVRLVTPVFRNESEESADKRLHAFMSELIPLLQSYIPGQSAGL